MSQKEVAKRQRVKELNAMVQLSHPQGAKHNHSAGFDPTKDPYAVLLAKLSGLQSPPKARQAYQQFMHESYAEKIAPIVAERWAKKLEDDAGNPDRTKEPKAGFRAQVAREVFAELPKSEQDNIAGRAKDEAATRRKAYQDALKTPASEGPSEARKFVGPLCAESRSTLGCIPVLIVGGPVPKFSGELRTIHVAYGRNIGGVIYNFLRRRSPRKNAPLQHSRLSQATRNSFLESELEYPLAKRTPEEDSRVRKKRKVDARSKSNAKAAENPTSIDTTASLPVPAAPAIWSNADGQTLDNSFKRSTQISNAPCLRTREKAQGTHRWPDSQSTVEGAAMHDGVAGDASSPAAPLSMTQPSSDGDLMAQLSNTSVSPITSSDHASTPTTATTTTSTPVPAGGTMGPTFLPSQCPTKAAPWFIHAHEQVTKEHLGCHFNAVLAAWIRVEAASKYESGPTTLSKTGRPEIITTWISRLRGQAHVRHEHRRSCCLCSDVAELVGHIAAEVEEEGHGWGVVNDGRIRAKWERMGAALPVGA
ncbi:hypothetical protein B0H13DRAFT_2368128 [Mycena leptocephala]|nr:hypothetical protein B0H13DRAFT_2368128 [Mycena leptocephala]